MRYLILFAIFLGFLTACGGGSSSSSSPQSAPITPPPARVNTVVVGPISGFGSIIVNGVRYNTDSATFTVDDKAGSQSDLKVGQVVIIRATSTNGGSPIANNVIFDDVVEGPISSIDSANNQLVILGQTVIIADTTSFDDSIQPASIAGLTVGDIVEVSGDFDANNNIIASRIEDKPAGSEFEVHGTVTALNSATFTFQLNALTVDYSAALLDNFGSNSLSNGDFVEVKGSTLTGGGTTLVARKVELEGVDNRVGDNNDNAEIRGFITEFQSAQSFSVGGVSVTTNGSTNFVFGAAGDLALNVLVEVRGVFNANRVLVADRVKFENEADIRVTSTVDTVDRSNNTLTTLGITFTVDASTRFEDKSDQKITSFGLSDISAGDYIEIRGFDRASSGLLAKRLEREKPDSEHEVQAFVESVGSDSLIIRGVSISTNSRTQYRDTDDSAMSRTEFFNRVAQGDLVKAKGQKTGPTDILAEQLSFEIAGD